MTGKRADTFLQVMHRIEYFMLQRAWDGLTDIDLFGASRSTASGWTSPYLTHHPIFTNAADAVSALGEGWAVLRDVIERTPDDQFEALTERYTYADAPPQGGLCVLGPPGPQHPATFFVAGTLNEMSHHELG